MNAQLSYPVAQARQQELHRLAEQARAVRGLSGESRFSALWHKLAGIRSIHRELQAPSPAQHPVAGGAAKI